MPLGNWSVELTDDGVVLRPGASKRRSGAQAITVRYDEVARVITTEPNGRGRGAFTLLLHDGGDVTIYFPSRQLSRMRTTHREVWEKVRTRV